MAEVVVTQPPERGAANWLAVRLAQHSGIYLAGTIAGLAISVANLVLFTWLLSPTEFGTVGLLLFLASCVTVLANLASLQGTLQGVFGSSGEDESSGEEEASATGRPREMLATGLVVTAAIAGLLVAAVSATATHLADLLGTAESAHVVLAAAAGGIASLWRLTVNVLRLERRPRAFVAHSVVRPIFVVAVSGVLVALGHGVAGAITGFCVANAAALFAALFTARRSIGSGLLPQEIIPIFRRGGPWVLIILGFWVIHQADLYLVSRYVDTAEVGTYRLASRLGAFLSYLSSALFMAWQPLTLSAVFKAAEEERGPGVVRGLILTYFILVMVTAVAAMNASAGVVVRIAPDSYSSAADLLPLLAVAFAVNALFIAVYRSARFPTRRRTYVACIVVAAVAFVPLALLLIGTVGPEGAPLASVGVFAAGTLVMGVRMQRHAGAPVWRYGRLALIIAGAVGIASAARALDHSEPTLAGILEWGLVLGIPGAALAFGVVPRWHLRSLVGVAAAAAGLSRRRRQYDLSELSAVERAVLELTVRHGWSVSRIARTVGIAEHRVAVELASALGRAEAKPAPRDARLAALLFSDESVAERDAAARSLWRSGLSPVEMHNLEILVAELRKIPQDRWTVA